MFHEIRLLGREVKSWMEFSKTSPASVRDVTFYAEDIGSYSYFEGLIEKLTRDYNTTIYYVTSAPNDPVFFTDNSNLRPFYINRLLTFFMLFVPSKLLIMTMPDLDCFHIKRSMKGANHVYLFHNIGSALPTLRYGALFHYDTIFLVGPHHEEEIIAQDKLYGLKPKELVPFGYYRLEKIMSGYNEYLKSPKQRSGQKPKILVGPTWGDNSTLNLCGMEFLNRLLEAGFDVTVRPHPFSYIKSPKLMNQLETEFAHRPNCTFEKDIRELETIYQSDLLISDWSGFVFEYAFGTQKPVLFIDVPFKEVNNRYREVDIIPFDISIRPALGAIVRPNELDKLVATVETLIQNREEFASRIIEARSKWVYNLGSSSEAGASYIRSYLARS
jgi:YidC/Oxa1 family membrane protein insertase